MTQRGQCPGKLSGFLKPRTFGPTFWKRAQQKRGWTQCLGECGSAAGHGKHLVTKGWTGGERRGHVWKRDTGQRCAHARLPGLRTGKDLVAAAQPAYHTNYEKQTAEAPRVWNTALTVTPYFFSSSRARNLRLHRNPGLVALKTHWPHVGLYASCDHKEPVITEETNLETRAQGCRPDFLLAANIRILPSTANYEREEGCVCKRLVED